MKFKGVKLITVGIIFLICLTTAFSETDSMFQTTSQDTGSNLVSLLFQEDEMQMVLSEMTMQTGVNIVIDPSVTGIVTIDVTDATIEEVFDVILPPRNMYYKKFDDYYFVCLASPNAEGFLKISETAIVELKNISPQKVMNLVPDYYTKFIKTDFDTNTIAITAPKEIIDKIVIFINTVSLSENVCG